MLGIGEAWRENEHIAYGYDFPDADERMARLEEVLQICRAMLTKPEVTFTGRYYRVEKALNYPRPVTPGGPPILVGGYTEPRTLELVAKYADAVSVFGDVESVRRDLEKLDQHCAEIGRDPAEIGRNRVGPLVIAPTMAEAERKSEQLRSTFYGGTLDKETFRRFVMVGDPDTVAKEVARFFEIGIEGVVFNLSDAHELDPVALTGETLVKHFGPAV